MMNHGPGLPGPFLLMDVNTLSKNERFDTISKSIFWYKNKEEVRSKRKKQGKKCYQVYGECR